MTRSRIYFRNIVALIAVVSICISARISVQATQSPQSIKIGEIEFFGVGSGSERQRGKGLGQRGKGEEQSAKSKGRTGKRKARNTSKEFSSEELKQLRRALPIKEGDEFDLGSGEATMARIKQTIRQTTGRDATDVNFLCCDDRGAAMIFIGLPGPAYRPFKYNPVLSSAKQKDNPPAKLRTLTPIPLPKGEGEAGRTDKTGPNPLPKGKGVARPTDSANPELPAEIVELVERVGDLASEAAQKEAREDRSQGYALSLYPPFREVQLKIREYALDHASLLHRVLLMSPDAKQRRAAAYALGYAPQTDAQLASLAWASRDRSSAVRNDATRALAVLAQSDSRAAARIPTAHFIAMLSSGSWSDRNKAGMLLSVLTAKRNPTLLSDLRKKALPALIEMARWRNTGHASNARIIIGRVAGIEETELQKLANAGRVEEIIHRLPRSRQ